MADNEILFCGGRRESVFLLSGSMSEITTTTHFETAFSDCALNVLFGASRFKVDLYSQTAGVLSPALVEAPDTLFVHALTFTTSIFGSGTFDGNLFEVRDSSGFPWLAIKQITTPNVGIYFNSGTGTSPVWTLISTTWTTSATQDTYDLQVKLGSPHEVTVYRNGSFLRTGTFSQALFTNAASVAFASIHNGGTSFSQILCTRGIATINAKVRTVRPTGIGANTGWSGGPTDVNEAVVNDSTIQSAATAGLKTTHQMGDVTTPPGLEIRSVFHWIRAKNDGTPPLNIRSVLRSGGVDFSTGNLSGIGLGYAPVGARYDEAPGGGNWTDAAWNSIEAGFEAAT